MKFKRFTKLGFLKEIGRELLQKFFERFKSQLSERGLQLPPAHLEDPEYFNALATVVMAPDGLPDDLVEAVYAIEEMATAQGQERLENAIAQGDLQIVFAENSSSSDLAMQVYLAAPEVLAQKNNELRLARLSSFEYHGAKTPKDRSDSFAAPAPATLALITADLNEWCKANNRGTETVLIEPYLIEGEFWFLIRHGAIYARMAKLEKGSLKMLHFRPAKDDVVVYDPVRDESRIHAGTKGEKALYLGTFGARLFSDPDYFSERKAFSLESLRLLGADALDVERIDTIRSITLRGYELAFGGPNHPVHIQLADDIFAAAAETSEPAIPPGGTLVSATFDILFAGDKKPRKITVRPPNTLKLGRYCDASAVQRWLSANGFRQTVKSPAPAMPPFPLPLQPPPAPTQIAAQQCHTP
jgi:hypothetical protein